MEIAVGRKSWAAKSDADKLGCGRSFLAPLGKGGTGVKVPLLKGDLGESPKWWGRKSGYRKSLLADFGLNLVKNGPIGEEFLINGVPATEVGDGE